MINTVQMTREIEETVQRTCSLLVFRLSEQAFALNIENVVQIIPMLRLTPVPQIDHTIEGIANIHGALVPVISVRRHLGLKDLRPGLYTPIILTRVGERQVGWIVDEVSDVISVPVESIIIPASILPEGMENTPVMSGLVYQGDLSILVLDPRYILRPSQFRKLNRAFPESAQPGPVSTPLAPDEDLEYPQAFHPERAALEIVRAALAQKQNELAAERQPAAVRQPAAKPVVNQAPTIRVPQQPVIPAAQPEPSAAVEVAPLAPAPSNGNGNGHAAAEAAAAEAAPTPTPTAAPKPETTEPTPPAAQAEEAPANDSGKARKKGGKNGGKTNGKKGSIIPNTAIETLAQCMQRRDINSVLAEQFALLADEVRKTDEPGD